MNKEILGILLIRLIILIITIIGLGLTIIIYCITTKKDEKIKFNLLEAILFGISMLISGIVIGVLI